MQTHYRFLRVKWPIQQRQSTEERYGPKDEASIPSGPHYRVITIIQHICSMKKNTKYTNKNTNESTHSENTRCDNRTQNCSPKCAQTSVHNTTQNSSDNLSCLPPDWTNCRDVICMRRKRHVIRQSLRQSYTRVLCILWYKVILNILHCDTFYCRHKTTRCNIY